nr:MAG TPA: hypothetical protein [Caudoviricetes sp.]
MICEKDVEDGKAFWAAAVASRVILPNGEEAERKACKSLGGISSTRMMSTGFTSSRTFITSITPWVLGLSHIP